MWLLVDWEISTPDREVAEWRIMHTAQDGNVAVSDYDNKWISIHEPGGKFLSKIGSNKVKKVN